MTSPCVSRYRDQVCHKVTVCSSLSPGVAPAPGSFGGRSPWVPRASRGAGWPAAGPHRQLAQPGLLVFPVMGSGRCPHDPSVKSEGSPGVREAQCSSDAGTLGSVTAGKVRLRTQTPCGSSPWARLNSEAVLLLYLRSVQQAALETSSGPGVLAWLAGAARGGHQHHRRGRGHRSVGPRPALQSGLTTWQVWSRTEGLEHRESRAETVDVIHLGGHTPVRWAPLPSPAGLLAREASC